MKKDNKNTYRVNGVRKFIKGLAFAIAFSSLSSSASFGSMSLNNKEVVSEHDQNNDGDFSSEVEYVTVNLNENYESAPKEEVKEEVLVKSESEKIDIGNYSGTSIVEALSMAGYDSSMKSRKELAEEYGIENYQGTASQNIELLNTLKSNVEVIKTVSTYDIINYLALLEGKTFKNYNETLKWALKNKIIKDYKKVITKEELSNILMNYAAYKGVDINNINNKIDAIESTFKDNNSKSKLNKNLALAYYYGYIDVDKENKINAQNKISINDVNYAFNNLIKDINIAINNKSYNGNKLVIMPNVDKYSRDNKDTTLINTIRGNIPSVVEPSTSVPTEYTPSNNESNNESNNDNHHEDKHEHHFSKWYYMNDHLERRSCSCGKVETKEHTLPSATYKYTSNNDGTHSKSSVQICPSCGHDFGHLIISDESCNYGEWETKAGDSTKEVRTCTSCGHKEERTKECAHTYGTWESLNDESEVRECSKCHAKEYRNHTYGNVETTYTYLTGDTHTEKKTKECSTCNHQKEISSETKNCNYGEWESNGDSGCKKTCSDCGHIKTKSHTESSMSTTANNNGTHRISGTCSDCGYTISREEACTSDNNYVFNPTISEEETHCTVCNGVVDSRTHSHNWSSWTSQDDELEERHCSTSGCTQSETRNHTYGDAVSGVETCSTCGHTREVSHVHSTSERNETNPNPSDTAYCYEKVTYCTISGCTYEVREQVAHNWEVTSEDEDFTDYECSHCHRTKTEEKIAPLMMCNMFMMPLSLNDENEEVLVEEEKEEVISNNPGIEPDPEETESTTITEEQYNEIVEETIQEMVEEQKEQQDTPQEEKVLELSK